MLCVDCCLGKITTVASANIFTNREYEMLLRSLNLRRLSYVILSAEKNHFLVSLPSIQEKLVDTLRNVSAPIVQSEVFLCVRVLVCRLSPHNLSSFWPVILTELVRISSVDYRIGYLCFVSSFVSLKGCYPTLPAMGLRTSVLFYPLASY